MSNFNRTLISLIIIMGIKQNDKIFKTCIRVGKETYQNKWEKEKENHKKWWKSPNPKPLPSPKPTPLFSTLIQLVRATRALIKKVRKVHRILLAAEPKAKEAKPVQRFHNNDNDNWVLCCSHGAKNDKPHKAKRNPHNPYNTIT